MDWFHLTRVETTRELLWKRQWTCKFPKKTNNSLFVQWTNSLITYEIERPGLGLVLQGNVESEWKDLLIVKFEITTEISSFNWQNRGKVRESQDGQYPGWDLNRAPPNINHKRHSKGLAELGSKEILCSKESVLIIGAIILRYNTVSNCS
jgi:hypothetical protein